MKKINYIVAAILILFTGCQSNKSHQEKWQSFNYDHTEYINDTIPYLTLKGDVVLPNVDNNESIEDEIRREIIYTLFGSKFTEVSNNKLFKKYYNSLLSDIHEMEEFNDQDDQFSKHQWHCEALHGSITLKTDSILCYKAERTITSGTMDKGIKNTTFLTFDLTNGHLLSEQEMFYPDSIETLERLMISQINKLYSGKENTSFDDDDELTNLQLNGNFTIQPDGLVYWYNPCEILSLAHGATSVFLSWQFVFPTLKRNSVIYHYAQNKL